MKIIGCDLHAAQQTIAMLDRETGEVVEKTLKHEGETVRDILRGVAGAGGGRARSHRLDGMVSAAARRTRDHVPRGPSGDDPKSGDAQAETRSTRCGVAAAAADRESVSGDLDTLDRAAGSAGAVAAPAPVGAPADARAERVARDRPGLWRAARTRAVESRRPGDAGGVAAATARRSSPR